MTFSHANVTQNLLHMKTFQTVVNQETMSPLLVTEPNALQISVAE